MYQFRSQARQIGGALALIGALAGEAAAQPVVTDVRIGAYPSKTRFVLEFNQKVTYQAFTLADPYRVVVDLPEIEWRLDASRRTRGGLIRDFRFGLFRSGVSRVVLDVAAPVQIAKSFFLAPKGDRPHRLVIDIRRVSRKTFDAAIRPRSFAGPAPGGLPPPVRRKPRRRDEKKVIVLDPGHGGVDPGTIGVGGSQEKRIVLAFANELRRRLLKAGRYRVVLTRERDVFVRLRERIAAARTAGADLFISLHADSIGNRKIRGGAVYTLSERASDREAAALAAKENKTDLIAGIDLNLHSPEVANILIDLAQRETMNGSVTFAEFLTQKLGGSMRLLRNNRRFAGFAVLKAPDVPSVLIELGYLSNRADERLLNDRGHRGRVAKAVIRAVDAYFAGRQAFKSP